MSSISPRTAARRLTLAVGAVAAATALFPTPASAAFTTGTCLGEGIVGQGASFANVAHSGAFGPAFSTSFCASVGAAPTVGYTGSGSGAGRRAFGERSGANADGSLSRTSADRFVGSDEPMKPAGQAQINQGTDAPGDEGLVHTLPVAIGGIAVPVNLPDGCAIHVQADGTALTAGQAAQLSDPADANKRRLQLTRAQVEGIFAGDAAYDTWGKLVPHINDGNGTAGEPSDAACAATPVKRIVRKDSSGTTYAFKEYLHKVNPARGWMSTYSGNLAWPAGSAAPVSGVADGGGSVVDGVTANDGSFGYGDLATVRGRDGNAYERQANATDDRYWVKLESRDGSRFVDPASASNGFQAGGTRGSSCNLAALTGVPGGDKPTLGDWSSVTAADSTATGYGPCTPTYVLAWDDYATPYKLLPTFDAAAEERKARTVKDYLESALTEGQIYLPGYDYAALPLALRSTTLAAIKSIGFDKAGDTGTGGGNQGGNDKGGVTPPVVTPPVVTPPVVTPPVVTPISNAFTAGKAKNNKGNARLSLKVPGAGVVQVQGRATLGKKKNQVVGSVTYRPKKDGTVAVNFKLNKKGASELKKRKKLRVSLRITFTPSGGQAATRTVTVNLKPAPKKTKKKAKKATRR